MIPLEEKQKELFKTFVKLKNDKKQCLTNLNNIIKEEDNILNEIKVVYNNDIKNINMQNIKDNFEKYKNFNEKYKSLFEKITEASNKCANLVKLYNEFINSEYENRKNIIEKANTFGRNGIAIDENNKKVVEKAEEILKGIRKYKVNELNDIFNNKVNKKMRDLNKVQEILVGLLSKK